MHQTVYYTMYCAVLYSIILFIISPSSSILTKDSSWSNIQNYTLYLFCESDYFKKSISVSWKQKCYFDCKLV
uniref:Uncharacterized protein n=1 Tax=Octopus bimaculoides TaxID=37653 RepID=A0A0L8ICH2_OCTBM